MIRESFHGVVVKSLLIALLAVAALDEAAVAQASQRSVWDSVFTREQAERGAVVVRRQCGSCHSDDLSGGDDPPGPPLRGRNFVDRWYGKTVEDLFLLISETMPYDAPGSLDSDAYINALSFILQSNAFPAGAKPLPANAEELRRIAVTPKP